MQRRVHIGGWFGQILQQTFDIQQDIFHSISCRMSCHTAICLAGCLSGTCNLPGECICNDGWSGTLCNTPRCRSGCRVDLGASCGRVGVDMPDTCICSANYTGALCNQPVCTAGCLNGGTCTSPNVGIIYIFSFQHSNHCLDMLVRERLAGCDMQHANLHWQLQ